MIISADYFLDGLAALLIILLEKLIVNVTVDDSSADP